MGRGTRRRRRNILAAVGVVMALAGPAAAARTTREGVALGAKLFAVECAGCHGVQGDGKGVADVEMQPMPRDLTSGKFKLRSTSPQSPITQAELMAILTNGVAGTAMPSFRFLGEDDRKHLAEYVASLAELPEDDDTAAVEVPPAPPFTPELVAAGKQLYEDMGCPSCHGPAGLGDGAAAPYLKDEWGSKTPPRNLVRDPFKGGDSNRDLYLRFVLGMPGTPMPSYADVVPPPKLWSLVAYVQSLRQKAESHPADAVAWGEALVAEKHCLACHSLPRSVSTGTPSPSPAADRNAGDAPPRQGGAVGPPLDLEARLLALDWAKTFLLHPRQQGKIYPAFPYRMPDLDLSAAQADAILAYLTSIVGRPYPSPPPPTPVLDAAAVLRGRAVYASACAACHHLDADAATPPLERQGPDLAFAAQRYDYDFMLRYLADPRQYDARAVMEPSRLPPDDLRAVADFVWSGGR